MVDSMRRGVRSRVTAQTLLVGVDDEMLLSSRIIGLGLASVPKKA